MRLSPNQKVIMDYVKAQGGKHVYIGIGLKAACFGGWEMHEIERPLRGLVQRKLLTVVNRQFYYLAQDMRHPVPDPGNCLVN